MRRPKKTRAAVEKVMIPRPPTWIRTKRTAWPKKPKSWGVSRVLSPVTQIALKELKKASRGATAWVLAAGSERTTPPAIPPARKVETSIRAGSWKRGSHQLS